MKVRIHAEPGELAARAEDVVRVVEDLSGRSLRKADGPRILKWMVLYVEPNPDGTRKLCENCPMWIEPSRCLIHGTREVTADMICGYHVFGRPMEDVPDNFASFTGIDPKLSGLETAPPDGTSCDRCKYYGARHCAVLDGAEVDPKGCCAAWTTKAHLEKATDQIKQTPAQFEYKVLGQTVSRAKASVEKIRKLMVQKINKVLGT